MSKRTRGGLIERERISTSKPNDYTKAWHKLNFHMNCNLSIVVIEQKSQYLFFSLLLLPLLLSVWLALHSLCVCSRSFSFRSILINEFTNYKIGSEQTFLEREKKTARKRVEMKHAKKNVENKLSIARMHMKIVIVVKIYSENTKKKSVNNFIATQFIAFGGCLAKRRRRLYAYLTKLTYSVKRKVLFKFVGILTWSMLFAFRTCYNNGVYSFFHSSFFFVVVPIFFTTTMGFNQIFHSPTFQHPTNGCEIIYWRGKKRQQSKRTAEAVLPEKWFRDYWFELSYRRSFKHIILFGTLNRVSW